MDEEYVCLTFSSDRKESNFCAVYMNKTIFKKIYIYKKGLGEVWGWVGVGRTRNTIFPLPPIPHLLVYLVRMLDCLRTRGGLGSGGVGREWGMTDRPALKAPPPLPTPLSF